MHNDSLQNNNAHTLRSYGNRTEEYITGTPPIDEVIKAWIDKSLGLIPKDGKILEVGSGFGRDAEYIKQKGFDIECSDAVQNFVELLKEKGFKTRLLNLLTDDLGSNYDMIFADAVLLHFTPEEFETVAKKIHVSLKDKGILALRMKQGDGPLWSNEKLGEPRYFYYWQEEELRRALGESGFEWQEMTGSYTAHNNAHWMHIIAKKR